MQTLYVVGISGMLGSAVAQEAKHKGYLVKSFEPPIVEGSIVINCAGAIPAGKRQGSDMVYANSVLPFSIAEMCEDKVSKYLHISTDCVFNGSNKPVPISIREAPSPRDIYGASKALGEKILWEYPNMPITVVRTSFIGFDHGLIKWFLDKAKKEGKVQGYKNALWTGSTVWEVARGILEIVDKRQPQLIEHLATEIVWSKYEVLMRLRTLLDIKVDIEPVQEPKINRALLATSVIRDLNDHFVSAELLEKSRL